MDCADLDARIAAQRARLESRPEPAPEAAPVTNEQHNAELDLRRLDKEIRAAVDRARSAPAASRAAVLLAHAVGLAVACGAPRDDFLQAAAVRWDEYAQLARRQREANMRKQQAK